MRKYFYYFVICTCVSFTCVSLILSILATIGYITTTPWSYCTYFIVTSIISFLQILFSHLFPSLDILSPRGALLRLLVAVMLPVFGIGGGIFHWFPLSWRYILLVLAICVSVYFMVTAALALKSRSDAEEINSVIQNKKKEKTGGSRHA